MNLRCRRIGEDDAVWKMKVEKDSDKGIEEERIKRKGRK